MCPLTLLGQLSVPSGFRVATRTGPSTGQFSKASMACTNVSSTSMWPWRPPPPQPCFLPCWVRLYLFLKIVILIFYFPATAAELLQLCPTLCATPSAHQASPSLGFSRQEHWGGLPFSSPMHESEKWKWSSYKKCTFMKKPLLLLFIH